MASSVATYIQENGFELSKPNRVIVGILMEDRLILDICADLELLCEAVKITDRQTVLYDGVGNIITMPNGDK